MATTMTTTTTTSFYNPLYLEKGDENNRNTTTTSGDNDNDDEAAIIDSYFLPGGILEPEEDEEDDDDEYNDNHDDMENSNLLFQRCHHPRYNPTPQDNNNHNNKDDWYRSTATLLVASNTNNTNNNNTNNNNNNNGMSRLGSGFPNSLFSSSGPTAAVAGTTAIGQPWNATVRYRYTPSPRSTPSPIRTIAIAPPPGFELHRQHQHQHQHHYDGVPTTIYVKDEDDGISNSDTLTATDDTTVFTQTNTTNTATHNNAAKEQHLIPTCSDQLLPPHKQPQQQPHQQSIHISTKTNNHSSTLIPTNTSAANVITHNTATTNTTNTTNTTLANTDNTTPSTQTTTKKKRSKRNRKKKKHSTTTTNNTTNTTSQNNNTPNEKEIIKSPQTQTPTQPISSSTTITTTTTPVVQQSSSSWDQKVLDFFHTFQKAVTNTTTAFLISTSKTVSSCSTTILGTHRHDDKQEQKDNNDTPTKTTTTTTFTQTQTEQTQPQQRQQQLSSFLCNMHHQKQLLQKRLTTIFLYQKQCLRTMMVYVSFGTDLFFLLSTLVLKFIGKFIYAFLMAHKICLLEFYHNVSLWFTCYFVTIVIPHYILPSILQLPLPQPLFNEINTSVLVSYIALRLFIYTEIQPSSKHPISKGKIRRIQTTNHYIRLIQQTLPINLYLQKYQFPLHDMDVSQRIFLANGYVFLREGHLTSLSSWMSLFLQGSIILFIRPKNNSIFLRHLLILIGTITNRIHHYTIHYEEDEEKETNHNDESS